PVSSFGEKDSKFLIVGLAPGMHGANRTGRPFSGDFAGNLLYGSLHKYGFASSAEPLDAAGNANPSLRLSGCRITNAVRCLPPQNKPEPREIRTCNGDVAARLSGNGPRHDCASGSADGFATAQKQFCVRTWRATQSAQWFDVI